MATRNIVPRATGEGQIGTSAKTWSAVYANDIAVTNGVTASTFTGDLTGDVTGDVTGNVTGDVTGDVTGTASGNLPLTGGTMTGAISFDDNNKTVNITKDITANHSFDIGWLSDANNRNGAFLSLRSTDHGTNPGAFSLTADDGNNGVFLIGYPNGNLTWNGNDIAPQTKTAKSGAAVTLSNITQKTLLSFALGVGTWLVIGSAEFGNNATGYRSLWFSNSDAGLWITSAALTQTGSYSGGSLFIQVSYILNVSSPKTYYLVGRQASGGNLTATGSVEYFRLSPIA